MTAQELRIGNYALIRYKGQKSVQQIDSTDIMGLSDNKMFKLPLGLSIEPIPLTEEWLLKFGFELNNDLGWYESEEKFYKIFHKNICIADIDGKYHIWVENDEDNYYNFYVWTEIKYVHQLQNLFFALTGEELTLKKIPNE